MTINWTYSEPSEYNCIINICGQTYKIKLIDHSTPERIEYDKHSLEAQTQNIHWAYEIKEWPFEYCPLGSLGFTHTYKPWGIDRNKNMEQWDDSLYCFYSGTPKHTLDEVKEMIEKSIIESFKTAYKKQVEKYQSAKQLMEKFESINKEIKEYEKGNKI